MQFDTYRRFGSLVISESRGHGKAGKGLKKTATMRVLEPLSSISYLILWKTKFPVENIEKKHEANKKCEKWITAYDAFANPSDFRKIKRGVRVFLNAGPHQNQEAIISKVEFPNVFLKGQFTFGRVTKYDVKFISLTPKTINEMKNNIELHAAFRALYFGQDVYCNSHGVCGLTVTGFSLLAKSIISGSYLQLRPLIEITDEELKMVGSFLLSGKVHIEERDQNSVTLENELVSQCYVHYDGEILREEYVQQAPLQVLQAYDYLRKQKFALPYLGITVEDQIEFGWIKLKKS